MMPKFIVTIDDLLPPHTVSFYILELCLTAVVQRHYFVTDENTAAF